MSTHLPCFWPHLLVTGRVLKLEVWFGFCVVLLRFCLDETQGSVLKKQLGGGFKYFLFSPLFGEDSHFDEHIFQSG